MGYQRKKRFGPIVDEYGPVVGGHRYKRYRPEPLAVTILKFAAKHSALVFSALSFFDSIRNQSKDNVDNRQIQKRIQYLKRKKFIAFPGKGRFTITMDGRKRLDKFKLDNIRIAKPKSWDNKWRILVFDIVEEKAHMRDYFRKRLKEIGFYHFQRSVFIFPYPCGEVIDELSEKLDIENGVHLITANRFEGDAVLVKHFSC